ncbi:LEA type 2 family protein [Paraflavitalea sp. CAU 1676]|uniref:LEA type 2 family protein n=1 Tax=Paraflavitalea sp. CAU 1676 TaxID=3032598 RepID=UPI0023DAA400|nr:LEA type 2 family protein [Paraflavitalea sp. CAU 1676]MDF2191966.1 LEA type 2 family protein [Paraflavitalea sp. CAU 1676]
MNKRLLIGLFPIVLLGCAKPSGFDYLGVRNIKVLKFGFKESTVFSEVGYYNPNKFPVTMKRAEVDVYVNNSLLGHSVLDSTIQIPKKDTFYLPVILTVNMSTTAFNLIQTLGGGQDSVKVKLDGKARLGRGGIFINYPIKYEGMQKLKF